MKATNKETHTQLPHNQEQLTKPFVNAEFRPTKFSFTCLTRYHSFIKLNLNP